MALKLYNDADIQAIADAIRSKNGLSNTYTVAEMALAIEALNVDTDPIEYVVPDLKACTRMSYAPTATATSMSSVIGNDNGGIALAVTTQNEWSFADRESGTFYLMPIPVGCNKVIIDTTDASIIKYKFAAMNSQNGTLTRVTDTGYVDTNEHQWTIGAAKYICISCIYSIDGVIKPAWGYDTSKIIVTFTQS